jgi:hypothetical protein
MDTKKIILILVVIVFACILCICIGAGAYYIFFRETDKGTALQQDGINTTETALAAQVDVATPAPSEAVSASAPQEPTISPDQQKWLVMLYQDGDDEILERDIFFDANEAEFAGSNERVAIVSLLDRYAGAFTGDGDWTGAKRFYLTADADLNSLHSEMVTDMGEANMGDPATLIDFATWAINTYPADRYVLSCPITEPAGAVACQMAMSVTMVW